MQLVYFWVENYKCLKNFEINLSSQYEIHYDKENNKLNVEETPEKHQLFKNIASEYECINDLTAIVGKNGVGKTTILDFYANMSDLQINSHICILVFLEKDTLYIKAIHGYVNKVMINNNTSLQYEYKGNEEIFSFIKNCNTDAIFFSNCNSEFIFDYERERGKHYIENLFDISNANYQTTYKSNSLTHLNNLKVWFEYLLNKNSLQNIKLPDYLNLSYNIYYDMSLENVSYSFFERNVLNVNDTNNSYTEKIYIFLCNTLIQKLTKEELDYYNNKFESIKISKKIDAMDKFIDNIICMLSNICSNQLNKYNSGIINQNLVGVNEIEKVRKYAWAILELIEFINNKWIVSNDNIKIKLKDSNEFFNIISNDESFCKLLRIDCFEFSSGEIALINMYSRFYSLIHDGKIKEGNEEITILIDECDAYLHPEWQRTFMKDFYQMCKDLFPEKKINVILTTHSPIVLSDIPKGNVRFLDKDENGKVGLCEEKIDTFGANIYNLYKNAFFLNREGSTVMGSLATEKINWAKDNINRLKNEVHSHGLLDDKDSKILKECSEIVSLIGEDIIKNYLQSEIDYINKKLYKLSTDNNLNELKQEYYNLDPKQKEDFIKYIIDINNKGK